MEVLNVIVAAAAAWVFGAIWYTAIGRQWMEASGLSEETIDRRNPAPYIVSFVAVLLAAGMTRHIMASAGVTTIGGGLMVGFGLGLFVVAPWIATNVMFGQRDKRLIWMDGVYPTVGMTLIGIVLALF